TWSTEFRVWSLAFKRPTSSANSCSCAKTAGAQAKISNSNIEKQNLFLFFIDTPLEGDVRFGGACKLCLFGLNLRSQIGVQETQRVKRSRGQRLAGRELKTPLNLCPFDPLC